MSRVVSGKQPTRPASTLTSEAEKEQRSPSIWQRSDNDIPSRTYLGHYGDASNESVREDVVRNDVYGSEEKAKEHEKPKTQQVTIFVPKTPKFVQDASDILTLSLIILGLQIGELTIILPNYFL